MQLKKEISYSRNVFIPLTNMCRNRCSYCGFRRDPGEGSWFMSPHEALELAKRGKAAGCSEALITLGELPEVHAEARAKLENFGFSSTVDYLAELCKQILGLGLLPHTNAGALELSELLRLRRYNASMGLMLENATELSAHEDSPGKAPELRIKTIEAAGELKIPFTTGILVGVGETFDDLIQSLLTIRSLHGRYGHIQEVIIQPFDPKAGTQMASCPRPDWRKILEIVAFARSALPNVGIQVPPNLLSRNGRLAQPGSQDFENAVAEIILAGADDFGGISPITPDFINIEAAWPSANQLRSAIIRSGFRPRERLPIYPVFVKEEMFMSAEVRKLVNGLADEEGYRAPII